MCRGEITRPEAWYEGDETTKWVKVDETWTCYRSIHKCVNDDEDNGVQNRRRRTKKFKVGLYLCLKTVRHGS